MISLLEPELSLTPASGLKSGRLANDLDRKAPFSWKPFLRVPNCGSFQIEKGEVNRWLKLVGIEKKIGRILKFKPYMNDRYNKYARAQITRLRSYVRSRNARI